MTDFSGTLRIDIEGVAVAERLDRVAAREFSPPAHASLCMDTEASAARMVPTTHLPSVP